MSNSTKTKTFISQLDYFIAIYREFFLSASKQGFERSKERGTIGVPFVSIDEALSITDCRKGKVSKKIIASLNKGIFYFTQSLIEKQTTFDSDSDVLQFTKIYDLNVGFSLVFIVRTSAPDDLRIGAVASEATSDYDYFPCIYAPEHGYEDKIDPHIIQQGTAKREARIENFKASLPKDFLEELKNADVGNFDPTTEDSKRMHKELLNNMQSPTKCAHCSKISTKALSKCSACKAAGYCNRDCQRANWKTHKQICDSLKHMLILMQTEQYY